MKHVVVVGVVYQDTILSVPHYPTEDSKLRATRVHVRRGGNSGNTIDVLQQLLQARRKASGGSCPKSDDDDGGVVTEDDDDVQPHLLVPLPNASSQGTVNVVSSFDSRNPPLVDFSFCWHHDNASELAASWIVCSAETSSRTIVNHNPLPEMTLADFARAVDRFIGASRSAAGRVEGSSSWWHFEGRIPDTTLQCIRHLRRVLPSQASTVISVEVEKPDREGLAELAAEADVVFYSRSWAESRGYRSPQEFIRAMPTGSASHIFVTWGEQGASALAVHSQEYRYCAVKEVEEGQIQVVDTIGAGDTFIAGMIFGLVCHAGDWDLQQKLRFAVKLASRKVQIDGFEGLADGVFLAPDDTHQPTSTSPPPTAAFPSQMMQ